MKISNIDPTKAKNDVHFEILISRRIRTHCMLDSNRLQDKSRHLVTFFTKTLKLGTYFIEKLSFKQEKILTTVCLWCNLTIHCIQSKITIYNRIFKIFFFKNFSYQHNCSRYFYLPIHKRESKRRLVVCIFLGT